MKFPQAAALASILTCARFASGQECLDSSQECINNMDNSNNSASLSPAGRDQQQGCKAKVSQGECNSNQYFMFQHCATECLRDEKLGSIGYFGANSTHLEQANCKDVEPEPKCEEDAAKGDCRIYPDWMTENCAKTCLSCFEPGWVFRLYMYCINSYVSIQKEDFDVVNSHSPSWFRSAELLIFDHWFCNWDTLLWFIPSHHDF